MTQKMIRNTQFNIRISTEEKELFEERATKENMTVSEYLVYAVMIESIVSGNKKVIKIASKRFARVIIEKFKEIRRLLVVLEKENI